MKIINKGFRKTFFLAISLFTLFLIIILIPSIFYFITETLIGLPQNVAELTHAAGVADELLELQAEASARE